MGLHKGRTNNPNGRPTGSKNKALQNFTDFLKVEFKDATKAVANFLHASPERKDELIDFLLKELNRGFSITESSVFSEERKIHKASKSSRKVLALLKYLLQGEFKPVKKQIAEINRSRIIQAIHNGVLYSGIMPTVMQIAKETGLSRQTVNKHFKDLRTKGYFEKQKAEKEILLEQAQLRLYKIGFEGNNVPALKAFLKLSSPPIPKPQSNYIQVNNLIITEQQLQQLPPEKFMEIQQILKPTFAACANASS